ncbi:MAG: glycosyltransferase family 4 protein [Alphaproteobacteria bacterium]|nr:glycosyltransferase family 4 protein [Alphaproteobacteria bacterium]
MRRPSILFINRVYPPTRGATGRVLRDLARSFAREGWQVTVITTGPKAITERDGAVRVIRVKAAEKPSGFINYLWIELKLLLAALRLPKTHLLVTMTDPPLLVTAGHIITTFKKNRHIHWCQDLYPDLLPALDYKIPGFILKALLKRTRNAMRKTDKVIVIGRCMARHLSNDGFDPKQITVIPNWPDFELVRPENRKDFNDKSPAGPMHSANIETYRGPEEQVKLGPKFRVLYAGNIGRAHPTETIMAAAEILNDQQPDIEFVFVGDGPRFDEIARQRSQNHLDNIRLLPYQPVGRLKDLMESGDVHIISMKEESAGLLVPSKLYAALAVQRPCILVGPAHSEAAKIIMDFKAGSIVSQNDPLHLAEEIRQMRLSSDKWMQAYEGSKTASEIFVPRESINAWIERAWAVVEPDIRE